MREPRSNQEIRREAEARVTLTGPPAVAGQAETAARLHELQVHQIELETQNEALRRAQDDLEKSRDRYCALYEQAPFGYVTLDHDGKIVEANLAASELLLGVRDSLVGRHLSAFMDSADADRLWTRQRAALHNDSKQRCDVKLRRRDGSVAQVRLQIAPDLEAPSGRFIVAIVDLTDLRHAQDELRQSEARFRQITEHIEDVLYVRELDGRVSYVSPAFERIWGRPSDWLREKSQAWLETVEPEEERARIAAVWEQIRGGSSGSEVYRVRRPDGTVRWVQSRSFAVTTAGEVQRGVGVVRDITNERALEENLRQAQKMEALGTLAGGVAHNVRNVLQTIVVTAAVLRKGAMDTTSARALDRVLAATSKGVALIDQLMALARKENGAATLQPVRLDDQINDAAGLVKALVGKQIALEIRTAAPGRVVMADPLHLDQILLNLAANARDAMPGGGALAIGTRETDLDEAAASRYGLSAGPHVAITVRDNGVGMDEATKVQAFDPFFTTKEEGKGTGLGLATTYALVRGFGGCIEVESQPGAGSTFSIWLPSPA